MKHFHGVSAGNVHACSLKPSIGKASIILAVVKYYAVLTNSRYFQQNQEIMQKFMFRVMQVKSMSWC